MVEEGIFKAFKDRGREVQRLLQRQRHKGCDLLRNDAADERTHVRVVHAVAHDVEAAQIARQHRGGVRTVEHAHLALAVGALVVREDHRQTGLLQGQAFAQPLAALDDPQAERLCDVGQLVAVAELFIQRRRVVLRKARDDAVDQGAAEGAGVFQPVTEVLRQVPKLAQRQHALAQHRAVAVDQLRREQRQPRCGASVKRLVACIEKFRQLAGKALRQTVKVVVPVEDDAGLRRVGEDELQRVERGQRHPRIVVLQRMIDRVDARHDAGGIDGLAVPAAAEHHRVHAVLPPETLETAGRLRLDHGNAAVKNSFFVGNVDHAVGKRAQEIPLAELQHAHRTPNALGQLLNGFHSTASKM